ncbi:hypothetical protein A4D02_28820 [Niastella koreensis]|uniref:Uncharacterized protein n=2 Tax=Niastella koreensis TaxID=354356 RepID=G8T771_NIAKG|nr:hypothetical protein [Niastella koreensis]AEW00096.1 hypothetical protein Niako_3802 [Niastella koreensis GR20-10]OQP49596.1 hypothetical protein A4D02_28820 [Niastella koreensis]
MKIRYALGTSDSPGTYETDKNGQISIQKNIITKQKNTNPGEGEVNFKIHFSTKKCSECSLSTSFDTACDKINITVVDNPRVAHVTRTTTYNIDGNEIYFESQTYTNSKGFGEQSWGNFRVIAGRITAITMNQ